MVNRMCERKHIKDLTKELYTKEKLEEEFLNEVCTAEEKLNKYESYKWKDYAHSTLRLAQSLYGFEFSDSLEQKAREILKEYEKN